MPQPIKPSSWSFSPKSTLERPKVSMAIAAVIAEWTWIEHQLISLVGNAMGASTNPDQKGFTLLTNLMAYNVMATAQNMRDRISLFEATVGQLLAESKLQERGERFLHNLKRRSRERNRLAHAVWMISPDFPEDLIEYEPKSGDMNRWTEADVIDVLDRIIATRSEAHDLLMTIVSAVHNGELSSREFGPKTI